MSTATATKPVTFISRFPNLRIVRVAEDVLRNEAGRKVGAIAPGSLQNERHGIEDDGAPWEINFEGGVFVTDDPILIDFLRNHKPFNPADGSGDRDVMGAGCNIDYWEQGAPPEELRPTLAEQSAAIGRFGALGDEEGLKALLDEERATHNRESVTQGAESALAAFAELAPQQGVGADPNNGEPPSAPPPTD